MSGLCQRAALVNSQLVCIHRIEETQEVLECSGFLLDALNLSVSKCGTNSQNKKQQERDWEKKESDICLPEAKASLNMTPKNQ